MGVASAGEPRGDDAGRKTAVAAHHRPRAKDSRAALQAHIRELRARFSPQGTDLKPEFEYELLSMFVKNELSARVTIPLLAVIFSLAVHVLGARDAGLGVAGDRRSP